MATKNFRSTVLEPTSEFAYGDKLRFTALATVGEVLKGSFSETTIGEDGVYSVDLQYGKHRIDYKPYEGVWRNFADVEVNSDTLATTLQDLALASVPVTDDVVLVLQGILADAETAKTESAAIRDEAAASAAAAAADAAVVTGAISDASFFKTYTFANTESATTSGSTGNYNLVMLDKRTTSASEMLEWPLLSFSLSGAGVVASALVIPLIQTGGGTKRIIYDQAGGGVELRAFYGIAEGAAEYALYVAARSTVYNNASIRLTVSTNKKLDSEIVGAVNIDSWLTANPSVLEVSKLEIGV